MGFLLSLQHLRVEVDLCQGLVPWAFIQRVPAMRIFLYRASRGTLGTECGVGTWGGEGFALFCALLLDSKQAYLLEFPLRVKPGAQALGFHTGAV